MIYLTLDLFLGNCDIDFDSIIFIYGEKSYSYYELIEKFDFSLYRIYSFFIDPLGCFIVKFCLIGE